MMLFRAVLVFHIAVGTVGLVLGPIAMTALKGSRLHAWAGKLYHWVMLAVCLSAAGPAWLDSRPERRRVSRRRGLSPRA